MKAKLKRALSLLLSLIMIMGCMSLPAFAAEGDVTVHVKVSNLITPVSEIEFLPLSTSSDESPEGLGALTLDNNGEIVVSLPKDEYVILDQEGRYLVESLNVDGKSSDLLLKEILTSNTSSEWKAYWNPKTVTFVSNCDAEIAEQTVSSGDLATQPDAPYNDGIVFKGWYSNVDLTTPFNFTSPITEDTTVYAKWAESSEPETQPTTYTVTFNANGGSNVTSQTVTSGANAVEPTAPTRTGYTFAGWYSDEKLTTAFDFNTSIAADTTLYAKWVDLPEATIELMNAAELAKLSGQSEEDVTEMMSHLQANVGGCLQGGIVRVTEGTNEVSDILKGLIPGVSTAMNQAYVFQATDTKQEIMDTYGSSYCCDFVVSFEEDVAADSVILVGYYGNMLVPLLLGMEFEGDNTTKKFLISDVGLNFTYYDIVNTVKTFVCGAINIAPENVGKTINVSLRIWPVNGNKQTDSIEVASIPYTFTQADLSWVECVDNNSSLFGARCQYHSKGEGNPYGVVIAKSNESNESYNLIPQTAAGPHFEPVFYQDTAEGVYHITNIAGLKQFRDSVNAGDDYSGKTIQLDADIDLSGIDWTPIGTKDHPFTGTFDGQDHTISNLTVSGDKMVGLFGCIKSATIKDVTLKNVNASGTHYVGALVGYSNGDVDSRSTISNCTVTVDGEGAYSIKSDDTSLGEDGDDAGGLIGFTNYTNVTNCKVLGEGKMTVEADRQAGGLIGVVNLGSTVTGCTVQDITVRLNTDPNVAGKEGDKLTIGGLFAAVAQTSGSSATGNTVKNVHLAQNVANGVETEKLRAGYVTGGSLTSGLNITGCAINNNTVEDCSRDAALGNSLVAESINGNSDERNNGGEVDVAQVGGVKYTSLQAAIAAAAAGDTITLLKDINLGSASLTIGKALTLTSDGVAKTITSSAAQAIQLTGSGDVTLEKVNVTATKGHGIQAGNDTTAYSGQLTVKDSTVTTLKRGVRVYEIASGFEIELNHAIIQNAIVSDYATGYNPDSNNSLGLSLADDIGYGVNILNGSEIRGYAYCINGVSSGSNINVTMNGGKLYGRAGVNFWGANNHITLTDVEIHGLNNETGSTEGFACIVDNQPAKNNTYNINQCKFYAFLSEAANNTETSTASEQMFDLRGNGSKMFINGNVTAYVAKVGDTDADASNGRFGLMYSKGCLMNNLVVLDRSAMNDLAAEIAALSDDVRKIPYGNAQDDLTQLTYTTEVLYCWSTGNQMKGVYCDFNVPFTSEAYKLCDGGLIWLQRDVELTQNLTANVSFSLFLDTYSITAGDYRIQIAAGATVTTDKPATGLFSVPEGYELVETEITDGFTYRAFVQQSTSNDTTKREQVDENTTKTTTTNFTMSAGANADAPSFAIKTEVTTTTTGENASSNTTTTFRPVEVVTSAEATVAQDVTNSANSDAKKDVVAAVNAYKTKGESATFTAALKEGDNATSAKVLQTTAAANAIAKAAANVSAAEISEAKVILKTELRSFETTDNSKVSKVVYDIKPVAQLYKTVDESLVAIGNAVELLNDDIAEGETFTFEIPVPSAMTANAIKVSHKGESGYSTEVGTYTPSAADDNGVRYITVTVDHFSKFELEEDTLVLGTAKVTANLTLEDEIRINFSVSQLSKDASNYYVTYQFAGETEPHIAYFNNTTMVSSGIYKFTVADCAAKQMTDKVNFKVYYDGVMVYNFDYSIRDYCVRMIKNSNDQKLKALCRAILDYGASAQTYFGYRTDALANADGYGQYDSNAIPAVDITNNVIALDLPSLGNGIRSVNANLTLVSKTEMNFILNMNDFGSIDSYTVTSSDEEEVSTSMTTSGNIVTIKVNGIAAKNLNHAYTLTFQCGDQENSINSITYSPLTYAYRSQNKAAGLGYLSKALYQYWFTAQQYFSK